MKRSVVSWGIDDMTSVERARVNRGCEVGAEGVCGDIPVCRVYVGEGIGSVYAGGWILCRHHAFKILNRAARDGEPAAVRAFVPREDP